MNRAVLKRRNNYFCDFKRANLPQNVESIRRLCDQFGAWLDIDAGEGDWCFRTIDFAYNAFTSAFGASLALLPEYRFLSGEIALADA